RPSPSKSPTTANFAGMPCPLQSKSASIGCPAMGPRCCQLPLAGLKSITQKSVLQEPPTSGAIALSARQSPSKSPTTANFAGMPGNGTEVLPPPPGRIAVHHPEVVPARPAFTTRRSSDLPAVAIEVAHDRELRRDALPAAVEVRIYRMPGNGTEVLPAPAGRI